MLKMFYATQEVDRIRDYHPGSEETNRVDFHQFLSIFRHCN